MHRKNTPRRARRATFAIAGTIALIESAAASAQVSAHMRFASRPHVVESGVRIGEHGESERAAQRGDHLEVEARTPLVTRFATVVRNEGSQLLRVHFGAFDLPGGSEIHLMSLADGAWQRFTESSLAEWGGWSAIFNGDAVVVQLLVAPDVSASFEIDQLSVNDPAQEGDGGGVATLCGTDSRVGSTDPRVGRLSSASCASGGACGGCTAWLTSIGSAMTAGHCGTADGGVIEFNVPLSSSNGTPVAASPSDQYPVGESWYAHQAAGIGSDWAIMDVGPNSNTGARAHWVQGYFHLAPYVPPDGAAVRITGCGIDNSPMGSSPGTCCAWDDGGCTHFGCNQKSLTLQTAVGPKVGSTANSISYQSDTEPANSGSPIIQEGFNFAVGVHTNGGCSAAGGANSGTRLTQPTLAAWLDSFLGVDTRFLDPVAITATQNGSALYPMRTLADAFFVTPTGGTLAIAGGSYPAATPQNIGVFSKAITLKAVSGTVVIGN